MIKKIGILYSLIFWSCSILGQDIHFSQFNDLPLNLNPALSGNMDGTFRAGTIYRNQWNSVTVPFESTALFADFKLFPKFTGGTPIGVGIQFMNDHSGSGGLTENVFNLHASYHFFITPEKNQLITAGLTLGGFQKSIDLDKLNFESQFIYETANFGDISSGEIFQNSALSRADIGLGVAYSWFDSYGYAATGGISIQHINAPNQSFLDENDRLAPRINLHGSGVYPVNNSIDIDPSFHFMRQGKAHSYVIGSDFLYDLGRRVIEKIDLKIGTYWRIGDALNFTVGINHDNWSLDLGYDFNVSTLYPASGGIGAFELSLSYVNRMYRGSKSMRYIIPPTRLL